MPEYYIDSGELIEVGEIISAPLEKGIVETMRFRNGKIFFFKEHMDRLRATLQSIYPDTVQRIDPQSIFTLIEQLIFKSEIKQDAKLRLIVSESAKYRIEVSSLGTGDLIFNEKGLRIGVYPDSVKNRSAHSKFKLAQQSLSNISKDYVQQHEWDECIWLNQDKKIVETDISNIFIVQNKEDRSIVKTPTVQDGCVAGIMRAFTIKMLKERRTHFEIDSLTLEDLKTADEIILTNAVRGIRWVGQFESNKYSHIVSKQLFDQHIKKADSS